MKNTYVLLFMSLHGILSPSMLRTHYFRKWILEICERGGRCNENVEKNNRIERRLKEIKGTVAWDFWTLFFAWIDSTWALEQYPKIFSKIFSFRGDIHEIGFFGSDFRVPIPGNFLKKQLLWIFLETWAKFNRSSQQNSANFRVLLPGN